ncbi:MAG: hypothetical protein FWF88_09585 [Peptococcaceae bacterium]|nr:hypothetical protein [Peptococcaceae bacterium]
MASCVQDVKRRGLLRLWVVVIVGVIVLASGFVILSIHNGKSFFEDINRFEPSYEPGRVVDHRDVALIEEYLRHNPEVVQAIAESNWFFAHASLGGNMLDGMMLLHKENPQLYPLVVQKVGSSGNLPGQASPGTIYAANRRDSDQGTKRELFTSYMEKGWGRQVTAVMNKLSYTDRENIDAKLEWDENIQKTQLLAEYYRYTMAIAQEANPDLKVVSITMPLTTNELSANFMRYAFNQELRRICQDKEMLLFDIADVESHFPDGTVSGDVHKPSGIWSEQLVALYTTDGGHMNNDGKRRLAKAWYAMAVTVTIEN